MQLLLGGEYGAALGRSEAFQEGLAQSEAILARTSLVEANAPAQAVSGETFEAVVRVTNLAGHKFPTGYPEGRRAWVHAAAGEDADGDTALDPSEVTFESNAYDAATGHLDADPGGKVYELKIGVWDWNGTGACDLVDDVSGRKMFHFVLNDCILRDNRIPPLGFVPNEETAPVDYAYPENPSRPGTLAHWDDTAYQVPVPAGATRNILFETSLYYQTTSGDYVTFLRDANRSTCDPLDAGCDPTAADPRPNRGEKLHDLWAAYGRSAPVLLGSARAEVTPVAPEPGACCVGLDCSEVMLSECDVAGGVFLGPGTTCTPGLCDPPPPGEASRMEAGAPPLRVTGLDRASGLLSLAFDPACDATDHAVVWGGLDGLPAYRHDGIECGFGVTGTAEVDAAAGSRYYLAVGLSLTAEGSYGRDSGGTERPERDGTTRCDRPRDLGADCD
jgi:hypothetical protein